MANSGSLIQLHKHLNLDILEQLSELDGNLYYKNMPIYIAVSNNPNNAITTLTDGIFVDNSYFLSKNQYDLLTKFSYKDNELYYNNILVSRNLNDTLLNHINNLSIHVTQDDKDLWNATLQNAKDYAKKLFDSVTSFTIEIVDTLPTENIKTMTIYFIRNDHDNESDYYEEYMYINDKWEIIGSTFVNLTPYLLKTDFEKYQQEIADKFAKYNTSDEITNILKDYLLTQTFNDTIKNYTTTEALQKLLEEYTKTEDIHTHENKDIIDKLSESTNGNLLFNGQEIKGGSSSDITISEEDNNAIQQKDDGIFVEDKTEQIDNIQTQVNRVSIAQKITNNPIGYYFIYGSLDNPNSIIVPKLESFLKYLINNNCKQENSGLKISNDGYITLTSGIWDLTFGTINNGNTGIEFAWKDRNNNIYGNRGWSPQGVTGDYDIDANAVIKIDDNNILEIAPVNLINEVKIETAFTFAKIINIGNNKTIDPVEYINTEQGLEDTPVGHIISHMGNTAPNHYLICDGTEYNINDYPYLAQHFKDEFGSYNYFGGDGINTFYVPDLRGEFLRGTEANSHTNQGSGANVGEHQDGSIIPRVRYNDGKIQMDVASSANSLDIANADKEFKVNGRKWVQANTNNGSDTYEVTSSYTTRPTNTSVLYCIKYEPTYYMTVGEYTVQGFEDYSEEEKIIGKWINGKPLYRKTLILTAPSAIGTTVMYKIDNSLEVKNLYGYIDNGSIKNPQCIPFNYYNDNNNFIFTRVRWVSSNQQIGITIGDSETLISKLVYITLEYTKTTDAENSFISDMLSTIVISGNNQKDLTEEELNNLITDTINLLNE